MKKIYFLSMLLLTAQTIYAQQPFSGKIETMKGIGKTIPDVVCPADLGEDAHTYVAPPKEYLEGMQKKARETAAKSTFIVTYHDFPQNTQQSFQRAVDIWSSLLSSDTPIRVDAYYRVLGDNVLGSARAADFSSYFPGIQKAFTWHPMALAEKIARRDVNGIADPDIVANFNIANTNLKWFFSEGTEKVSPAGTYDFTSVVLHELGHGLGFVSSFEGTATDGTGSWGYGTGRPFAFDQFVVNATGDVLIDTLKFKNSSIPLKAQLTGGALFINSPSATAANAGQNPKLYAPRTYAGASSVSHWDDKTYPAGTLNSLMTPSARPTEINNNPGPLMLGFFNDMGWKGTSLLHTAQKDIEVKPSSVTMKATIKSDTTLTANSMKLYYTTNNDRSFTNQKVLDLTKNGSTNDFSAVIPITAADTMVLYYMVAKDAFGVTNTTPPLAPKYYWSFKLGKQDKTPPNLEFYPTLIAKTTDRIDFLADVEDDFAAGVDSVYMEYSINAAAQKTIGINKLNTTTDPTYSRGSRDAFTYLIKNIFPNLKVGDRVKYRISATDKSLNKNKAVLPNDGTFFELAIADPKPNAVAQYENNFDAATTDFVGVGFSIAQPAGFSGSIHSDHPYLNGNGYNYGEGATTDRVMQLLQPITLKASDAIIRFDEIALVEPNDKGGTFAGGEASGFYDYAVVEGSLDGYNWTAFDDGYNCRAYADWLSAWNKTLVKDVAHSTATFTLYDSGTIGTTSLFHLREIDMLKSGTFKAGNVVFIRFRLFSDELSHGWGWAIDNLRVQVPLPPPVLAVSQPVDDKIEMTVSPNPSPDALNIKATLKQAGKVQMEVIGSNGSKIMTQNFTADSQNFNQNLDLKNFPAGTYFIRLYSNDTVLMKKFVVAK